LPRKKYRMIGLPEELYLEVERIVDAGKYGYASVSEFVKDAVRRRLEEIAKLKETQSAHNTDT
jgi:Arc/MetJ-type ribon-helix-helix transcriptional regulator